MTLKDAVRDLLETAYQEQTTFIDSLPDEQRDQVGTFERWSAKDLVAHIVAWELRLMDNLAIIQRGEQPPEAGPIDEENRAIYDTHQGKSWAEVRALAADAYGRAVALVESLSEEELNDPAQSPWRNERPAWPVLIGNYVTHAMLHLGEWYAQHDQRDHATQFVESITERLLALSDVAAWQAACTYNLACFYALTGQQDAAIARLGEALRLNPDLAEWSQQDPDLASIRDEAAVQALYE